jgi:DNA-binding NarL/FixJ family response regulator
MRSSSSPPDSAETPVRVVIADDHALLRQGVVSLLEEHGFDVVAQAGDADDLVRKVGAHRPDVAIIDIRMPPTNTDDGLRAAVRIRDTHPDVGVLVLSQYIEADYALELIGGDARGVGYLLKDRVADVEEFAGAVRRVAGGGSVLDPEVVRWMLGRQTETSVLAELTAREREVLALVAEGCSNQGVAQRIFITQRAVEKHVTAILSKLGLPAEPEAHRRVLAVLAYLGDASTPPAPAKA